MGRWWRARTRGGSRQSRARTVRHGRAHCPRVSRTWRAGHRRRRRRRAQLPEPHAIIRHRTHLHIRTTQRHERMRRPRVDPRQELRRNDIIVLHTRALPVAVRRQDLEHVHHTGLAQRLLEHDTAAEFEISLMSRYIHFAWQRKWEHKFRDDLTCAAARWEEPWRRRLLRWEANAATRERSERHILGAIRVRRRFARLACGRRCRRRRRRRHGAGPRGHRRRARRGRLLFRRGRRWRLHGRRPGAS